MHGEWQTLFLALGLQDELPMQFVEETKLRLQESREQQENEPTTPVRGNKKQKTNLAFSQDTSSPAKPGTAPKRVNSARPAGFVEVPKPESTLLPAKSNAGLPAKDPNVKKSELNLDLDSDDDEARE